jgi:hypothetical protein
MSEYLQIERVDASCGRSEGISKEVQGAYEKPVSAGLARLVEVATEVSL